MNLFHASVERRKQCCGVRKVERHVRANDVPYNPLHDHGYPSIGRAPCTRPVWPGEDLRAGRWWREAQGTESAASIFPRWPQPHLDNLDREWVFWLPMSEPGLPVLGLPRKVVVRLQDEVVIHNAIPKVEPPTGRVTAKCSRCKSWVEVPLRYLG